MKYLILIVLHLFTIDVYGQELTLFQETESDKKTTEKPSSNVNNSGQNSEPEFKLVGVSRYGDNYFASLEHRGGKKIQIEWKEGRVIPIKEYFGFSISDVGSRHVSINYPSGTTCSPSNEFGVTCNQNIAVIRLSNKSPIENIQNEKQLDLKLEDSEIEFIDNDEEETTQLLRNPFSGELQELPKLSAEERAEREARRQRRAEQFRNFEIVRIPDDEVPEGMQRIRTPFGDSLEPIDE